MFRDVAMIAFVTCCTLGSQLMVKRAVTLLALRDPVPSGIHWLIAACLSPYVIAAVVIQAIGFITWVVIVSRVKLGMAFAISGAFLYLLIAFSSWLLYGERLLPLQWGGLVLISTGVLLMMLAGRPA